MRVLRIQPETIDERWQTVKRDYQMLFVAALGSEVASGTPEQFAQLIRKETIKWGGVVKRAGIKID